MSEHDYDYKQESHEVAIALAREGKRCIVPPDTSVCSIVANWVGLAAAILVFIISLFLPIGIEYTPFMALFGYFFIFCVTYFVVHCVCVVDETLERGLFEKIDMGATTRRTFFKRK